MSGETRRPSRESKSISLTGNHSRERFGELIFSMLHIGRARHFGPRCPPWDRLVLSELMLGAGCQMVTLLLKVRLVFFPWLSTSLALLRPGLSQIVCESPPRLVQFWILLVRILFLGSCWCWCGLLERGSSDSPFVLYF